MHHPFFACWSVRQQYCFSYRLLVKKKVVNILLSVIKKQVHLTQNKWNRTLALTVVGQNPRKAMT